LIKQVYAFVLAFSLSGALRCLIVLYGLPSTRCSAATYKWLYGLKLYLCEKYKIVNIIEWLNILTKGFVEKEVTLFSHSFRL